jgi:DNA-binding cell septation regulator SpoVG
MRVEILKVKLVNRENGLRALVDIKVDDLEFREFRVLYKSNGNPAVAAPQASYKDEAGRIRFNSIVILPEELRPNINEAILSAYYRAKGEEANGTEKI